jgi:hypothetical protein
MLPALTNVFGQKIRETNFAFGINKTASPDQQMHWNENSSPTYLTFQATKSWDNNNHRFSIRKEAGLNLQYSNIGLDSGGLGGHNYYSGNITSLFADAALLAQLRITRTLTLAIGPEVEFLLIGYTNLMESYYYYTANHPVSGDNRTVGLNRAYFNQPAYGFKFILFETGITEKTTIGLNFSYLWTKSEFSNFYAANYTRISFVIGIRKGVDEKPIKE